ncbi:MAG: glycosyltransferase [Aureispira sp.]|nr:glycosyltransferase [Aureispira sp.]
MTDCLLIVFVKNPALGRAKTRLAASIGDEKALEVYKFLLEYTRTTTQATNADKVVFYTDFVDKSDSFDSTAFQKQLQIQDDDLGERMYNAFEYAFGQGYERVLLIGSDCYELSTDILNNAFDELKEHEFVIGPANDGGYYLVGMNRLEKKIFTHKTWSTAEVFGNTVQDFENIEATYAILPMLTDIDYLEDMSEDLKKRFNL